MNATEFYYWLQGAIEIGNLTQISDLQKDIIISKARGVENQTWFTFTAAHGLVLCNKSQAFKFLRDELQKVFIHDVDPNYEGDQDFLMNVHNGIEKVIDA